MITCRAGSMRHHTSGLTPNRHGVSPRPPLPTTCYLPLPNYALACRLAICTLKPLTIPVLAVVVVVRCDSSQVAASASSSFQRFSEEYLCPGLKLFAEFYLSHVCTYLYLFGDYLRFSPRWWLYNFQLIFTCPTSAYQTPPERAQKQKLQLDPHGRTHSWRFSTS